MLSVKDIHKSYQVGKTTYEVLKGVSLQVEKGEFGCRHGSLRFRQDHPPELYLLLYSIRLRAAFCWEIRNWPD